jgi:hypothetical protein
MQINPHSQKTAESQVKLGLQLLESQKTDPSQALRKTAMVLIDANRHFLEENYPSSPVLRLDLPPRNSE